MFSLVTIAIAAAWSNHTVASSADCRHLPTTSARAAMPNDNRARAGVLRNGVLTVHLVARVAAWRPEGSTGCALTVHAFAEEGRPAQIPGPLLPTVQTSTSFRRSSRRCARSRRVRGCTDV